MNIYEYIIMSTSQVLLESDYEIICIILLPSDQPKLMLAANDIIGDE